ncbi:MAG: hypothetical protein ACUVRY_07815 [Thermoanaerobaculaceae bacterium]
MADPDKPRAKALASRFQELGFSLLATGGTAAVLRQAGFALKTVKKLRRPPPRGESHVERGHPVGGEHRCRLGGPGRR